MLLYLILYSLPIESEEGSDQLFCRRHDGLLKNLYQEQYVDILFLSSPGYDALIGQGR